MASNEKQDCAICHNFRGKPYGKLLGMTLEGWAKALLTAVIGAVVFLFTWYNTVNRDINQLNRTAVEHTHKLEELEKTQDTIRDSTLRQEIMLEYLTKEKQGE